MKKSIRRLVVAVAVVLGLGFGTTAFAESTNDSKGTTNTNTQVGITIVNNNPTGSGGGGVVDTGSDGDDVNTGGDGDNISGNIPNGHKPTVTPNHGGQGANANSPAKKPAGAVASVVHSGTADLVAGRLPQTGESQVFLASVFGLFLLIAIVLLAVVRWQARLLREHR
ncbi:LPXTG cell wall anchor domain-containing protein [Levilactobacillus tujiorum]|uniref:LPXTG cell wall anchor domain-containing protein n=1 Tax=Levilactobacillus tujiorum TaxID=2912243 RepID=A0ABX1L5G8_9LACO|nr:LPXTG cell wall anchor domain-containing protein [Levilactobacillus tujiorum]MCH5465295.1 LPXTG cell wall anchor domain-containing protein [Levilactobacillus tujiorum]NLR12286.1 LPXTG cell wall anchor domain-containing protein [Lactobacillus sp. HBUAS51387]NLR30298.1 LPXTG cell wall anchor domain-containing protein [Levilactobacillus tujiorum]